MRHGLSNDEIHGVTMFDPWFLDRIREIVDAEEQVKSVGLPSDEHGLRHLKMMGFTDARLAKLTGMQQVSQPSSSASTLARPSSKRKRPTCTPPTRPQ